MKLFFRLPFLALCLSLLSAPALAQTAGGDVPLRIAVVDVQKVLAESTAGKAAFERLRKLQEERMETAKRMDEEVRTLDADINSKRAGLSETRLNELQRQLADKRMTLQRFAQNAEQEIGAMRDREMQVLESKIKPIIDALAKELKLAALFNKFESGLIFADDRLDISDEVIKRFDALK